MAGHIPPPLPISKAVTLGLIQRLGLIGLCAISVLLSGLALDFATDGLDEAQIRETMHEALADPNRKIAFVGTSRFLRGINPPALQREMEQFGCPVVVYVFALAGLSIAEERRIIGRLASDEMEGTGFDLVMLDRTVAPMNMRDNALRVGVTNLQSATIAINYLRNNDATGGWGNFYSSVRIAVLTLLSESRLSPYFPTGGVEAPNPVRGYQPFGENQVSPSLSYSEALASGARALGTENTSNIQPSTMPPQLVRSIRARFEAIEQNRNLGFLFMPVADVSEGAQPGLFTIEPGIPILNMNDPATHSSLSDLLDWYDAGHLSNEGTEKFAPLIAPHLCSLLEPSSTYALR